MASSNDDDAPDKLAELLASVYGQTEADTRDAVVQSAIKRLEVTHRQAASALRNFEQAGTVESNTKSGGVTPDRRRKEPKTPASAIDASKPAAEQAKGDAGNERPRVEAPAPSAKQEPKVAAAPTPTPTPAAQPGASQAAAKKPKLAPAKVVRVPLTFSRDPLEIHSGQGRSIDFD